MAFSFSFQSRPLKKYYDLVRSDLEQVEALIRAQVSCFDPEVAEYMERICRAHGKLIRPALVLLTAGATGGIKPKHYTFAAMLEMVHMATLIHDDVIDHAETRRNEKTPNKLWGNELAVLLGDILLSHAMVMGTELGDIDFSRKMAMLVRDVCQGEVEQSSRLFDLDMTRSEYMDIIQKKTASLFAAAMGGAAWISGVDEDLEDSLYRSGDILGRVYQIYDDCLDLTGDEDEIGKTLRTDAEKGKLTLPIFNLLDSDSEDVAQYVREAIENRQSIDYDSIKGTHAFEQALEHSVLLGQQMTSEARSSLLELPETPYRDALVAVAYHLDELLDRCKV